MADIVRTCLGPRAMLKMLLDPMGGIVITNDGNAILREIDVGHPAAKSMLEVSRSQDEEVGDGTTSVIILSMSQGARMGGDLHMRVWFGGRERAVVSACACLCVRVCVCTCIGSWEGWVGSCPRSSFKMSLTN